jgi:uncharacterized protein (DUF2249 family)
MQTAADLRGLSPALRKNLLIGTFQLLRPGQCMAVRTDAEDEGRRLLESHLPGQFTWARGGDCVVVTRVPASKPLRCKAV